ncbi:hypothetical protein [Crocosphaera subtropica]|uniref:hypothetical protein n=1 Tax=Crocosphaera subtropica TaxID=2546360 RepID=UPI00023140F5|nr:hypothetical protein [Crocosphaera subtropica]
MNKKELQRYYSHLDKKAVDEQSYYLVRLTQLWGEECLNNECKDLEKKSPSNSK